MAKSGRGMMPRQTALQRRGFRSPTPPRPSSAPRRSSNTHAGRPQVFTPPPIPPPPIPPRAMEPPVSRGTSAAPTSSPSERAESEPGAGDRLPVPADAASARRQELEDGGSRGDRRRG